MFERLKRKLLADREVQKQEELDVKDLVKQVHALEPIAKEFCRIMVAETPDKPKNYIYKIGDNSITVYGDYWCHGVSRGFLHSLKIFVSSTASLQYHTSGFGVIGGTIHLHGKTLNKWFEDRLTVFAGVKEEDMDV